MKNGVIYDPNGMLCAGDVLTVSLEELHPTRSTMPVGIHYSEKEYLNFGRWVSLEMVTLLKQNEFVSFVPTACPSYPAMAANTPTRVRVCVRAEP